MSLLPQIPGVLIRIRCFPILISGDIEKAFLQLGLDIRDRDACRFLWKFPGEKKISCLRFMVVPFGVKTSPYLLNETIKHHLQLVDNELCRSILRNVYVDNIFMGVSSTTEGKAVYHDSKELFNDAQMRLTQFFSNSPELNTYMAEQEKSPAEGAEQKILGVQWNTCTDQFGLKLPPPIQNQLTKRRILQTIATAYDPLGILAPVILLGKLFFQKLWMRTRDWDSPLSEEEIVEWTSIENKWKGPQINFGRQYFTTPISPADKLELHVFSDASDGAYGAVAYLRRLSDTCNESTILSSKSRLSPVKKTYSIPQKELLGIEKAAQLATFIMKEMEFSFTNCYVWSDSLCSVDQLATNKASTMFSRNRLRKIKELLPSGIFSHVPGKNNPADLVSRGCSLQELQSNELWWKGPPFLQSQDPLPIRESSLQNAICNLTIAMPEVLEPIIEPERFSSFNRMLNVIMTVLFFTTRLMKKAVNRVTLRERAKLVIIRVAQAVSPPSEDIIRNLGLKSQNGIWYFEGRQPSHNVPYLPHGPTAKLLILEIHQKHHHSSTLYTLSKVREEAWIAHGNSFVKRTLKGCLHCKRNSARPYYQPDFPPLPDMRITWSKPFTYVGMDYCGPVKATNNGETRQFWFLLFTCLTSRFTSVELVSSMDTRTLLNAVRRIAAQHGSPQLIYTDNAAQIKLLEKVVSEARNQQRCLSLASNDLPIFKFIPALSPWSGGIYERVVGIFKKCLVQAGTTRSLLTEDDLRTLMKEAESIINDRPLTTTSPDMTDLHPLRPSDFVTPNKQRRSLLNIEETLDTLPLPVSQASLLDDWMRLSSLSQHFISRWNTEYLQMLQGRYQTEHHQSHLNKHSMPRVGDIVLIDETGPFGKTKGNWPLAKIVKVDSRSALLRNSRTNEIVERPFKKIIPLELSAPVPMESKSSNSSSTTHSDQPPNPNDPIASRTRSRTPGLTALAITMVALLSLTSVQAVETTSNASSPVMNPPSSTVPGLNIEDAYAISTSLLQEIATRLGYTVLLFGLVAILYCVSILIQVSTLLSSLFSILLKVFRSTLWWIRRIVCLPFSRTPPLVPAEKAAMFMLLTIVCLSKTTMGCNEVAHINSKETVCYDRDDLQECVVNTVSIVNLRTMGSSSCLKFHFPQTLDTDDDDIFLSLKIEAEAIIMQCNKHVIFYSRDHKLEWEYMKRCDTAGSCSIDKCVSIKPNEDLPELSNRAKSSPGYTSCAPGCGCVNCGCFYCDPACLFYRYYAQPTSETLYEVSRCATWSPILRSTITLNENSTIRQDLLPGVKFQLPGTNISITAINLDNPPIPAHLATFITAYSDGYAVWHSFTHTQPSAPGVPTRGLVGELHCATKSDAESFDCTFDPALCRCVGFATKVSCECRTSKISDYKLENRLPFKGQHHTIQFDRQKERITIESVQDSLVALQVEAVNATINRQTTITRCTATQIGSLSGCHSCEKGAKTTIGCSSRTSIKALLDCPNFQTSIECGLKEVKTEIIMSISSDAKESMLVDFNCSVSCGIVSLVQIRGQLDFESTFVQTHGAASFQERIADATSLRGNWIRVCSRRVEAGPPVCYAVAPTACPKKSTTSKEAKIIIITLPPPSPVS